MVTRPGYVWIRRSAAALAGLCAVMVTVRGQELPTGAELVARHVQAIGGADAWRALSSVRVTGTTELPAQNLRGTFEMLSARPARSVVRMDLAGIGRVESGFDGRVGWMIDPMVGPSLVTGAALAEMTNDAQFDATLYPQALVASVVTVGRADFDGRPAFKVKVTFRSGQERDDYFDVERGLLLGSEGPSETPMGRVPMRLVLRDYKPYGAITQPSRLVQSSMGFDQHFVVETVEFDTVKPEALDPPAVIRALIKTESWHEQALASFDEAWATIRDAFYDPTFGGLDWEQVRASLRPKVVAAPDAEAARAVIREMLATLQRSHFALLSPGSTAEESLPPGDALVPLDTRLVAGRTVITSVRAGSLAAQAGLRPGQALLAVDGESTDRWGEAREGEDPRATAMRAWRRAQRALRGPDRSEVRLRVSEHGRERSVTVRRERADGERVVLGDLPPFRVQVSDRALVTPAGHAAAIVSFNVWMASADRLVEAAVDRHRSARGLVLDLRGNPGGLAAMIRGVGGHFFDEPVVLGHMKMRHSDLEFPANPRTVMPDGRRVQPFSGPVALLVDELTASASECFAGGLQSLGRARVFGRTTAGQALPASTKRLANGDLLMYVVGDFVTATGRRLEGDGVVPEEPVTLDPAVLLAGHDPDLDAALRWLDTVLRA